MKQFLQYENKNEEVEFYQERVDDAKALDFMIKNNPEGWRVLTSHYEKLKDFAFRKLRDESLPDETLKSRQIAYNKISEIADVPKLIKALGKEAEEFIEIENKKVLRPTFNKELINK